jgi:HNH endonuclease
MGIGSEDKLMTEFEAAVMVGFSPELLRWLTKYAPKHGEKRKLKVAKEETGVLFFDKEELRFFNEWLRQPWPQVEGKRPPIPSEIRNEIKREANGECAMCNSHKDTCEAAHLDPVAKSRNNHPENLLWLCRNHHKSYDAGLFGPDDENAEFVGSFKVALHYHKMHLWRMQSEASGKLFSLLTDCDRLAHQLSLAKTQSQVDAVKRLAYETVSRIAKLPPVLPSDSAFSAFEAVSEKLKTLPSNENDCSPIEMKLETARSIREEFSTLRGYVQCPLCEGSGDFRVEVCPECGGEREMPQWRAERVDVNQYADVECPLCEGSGDFRGEVCPECGGARELPQ